MKIKISRSFDRKMQVKQFEPVSWFCSAEVEVDIEEADKYSKKLDEFCQFQVAESLNLFEVIKPQGKFDFKKDYTKLYFVDKKKSEDVGRDSAEHDTAQYIKE